MVFGGGRREGGKEGMYSCGYISGQWALTGDKWVQGACGTSVLHRVYSLTRQLALLVARPEMEEIHDHPDIPVSDVWHYHHSTAFNISTNIWVFVTI